MQFNIVTLATIFTAVAHATPGYYPSGDPDWTVTDMQRSCDKYTCAWKFVLDTHLGTKIQCEHKVNVEGRGGTFCDPLSVESEWSGKHGEDGNTLLRVYNHGDEKTNRIIFMPIVDASVNKGQVIAKKDYVALISKKE